MKQIIFLFVLMMFCAPAFAVENDLISNKNRNINSSRDGYNLPEYEVTGRTKWSRKFNAQSQASKKNNAPALTIINEPYMPAAMPSTPTNLKHMGQVQENANSQQPQPQPQPLLISDDMPTEISPPPKPVKVDITTTTMPSSEPVQSYKPETLVIDEVSPPMPLTPEPLPVQEVASLDAADPMPLEPIAHQETLPQRARFYALAGTSLRESLRAWAGTQEFSLVWDSGRDFSVKQTVSSNNDAELALRDILSMYEGDAVRPIGKLYRDPRTSRPVLVIKSDK